MPAPDLVHVATMRAQLHGDNLPIMGGPKGSRVVAEVDAIDVTGDRFTATMAGKSAADWLTLGPDATYGTLDVRFTLTTSDGVTIYCEYGGKIDLVAGRAIAAPTFECGDERYDWLNRTQFIADGMHEPETNVLTYELYAVHPADD